MADEAYTRKEGPTTTATEGVGRSTIQYNILLILPKGFFRINLQLSGIETSFGFHEDNRDLTQQDGWKTQDGRMTKKCCARLCIPGLARHFYTSFFRPESSSRPVA